jgi:glycosyltransferase involved in cell wall biosynthesis
MNPRISIVIPLKNGADTIEDCLTALNNQVIDRRKFEVIVVDDGSTDKGALIAANSGAKVIHQDSSGPAAARNLGVKHAQGKYILFTDADCKVPVDWIQDLLNPIISGYSIGSVGCYISNQKNWVANLIQIQLEERYARLSRYQHIDFVNTGTAAFEREVLGEEPFDVLFERPGLEDLDLSFRLANQGHKIVFLPEVKVEHQHPDKLVDYLRRRFHYAANCHILYGKYPKKMTFDTGTPQLRRLQLLGTLIGILLLPFFLKPALFFLIGSHLLSMNLIIQGTKKSLWLGLGSIYFIFLGNLAFLSGLCYGLFSRFLK